MISQDNFVALLESLGFTKNKSIYSKTIGATSLSVDVTKQTIYYPESDGLIVNERPPRSRPWKNRSPRPRPSSMPHPPAKRR